MMWTVQDRLMGFLDEFSDLEMAKKFAKAMSRQITQLIEVIDQESKKVLVMYLEGEEWCQTKTVQLGFSMGLPDEAAKNLGRAIWVDLASRHQLIMRLRKKLKPSAHEIRQFEITQDMVQQREAQLVSILSDNEYECCYYKFIQQPYPRQYPDAEPHFCDRQIRRYASDALKKTGQTAHFAGWKAIGLKPDVDTEVNEEVVEESREKEKVRSR